MSCFETSTFLPDATLVDIQLMVQACERLGWTYQLQGSTLSITQTHSHSNLRGENAFRIEGNQITMNTYYFPDRRAKVSQLQATYQEIQREVRVEYALEAILSEFKQRKFSRLEDRHFEENERVKYQFFMVGRSRIKSETEPKAKIKISILQDGSLETDSNYIPEDIHTLADDAMAGIESKLGTRRTIRPKKIPAKYHNKAFCKPKTNTQLKNNQS